MFTVTELEGTDPSGRRVSIASLEELSNLITRSAWSPAVFAGDYRNLKNFEQLQLLGLDIDHGVTLAEAREQFASWNCIIGTTRSHQKVKHPGEPSEQPACDRFRIVLLLDRPITSDVEFKKVFAAWASMFPAVDPSAKDASRFWYSCQEVVFCNPTGRVVSVDDALSVAGLSQLKPPAAGAGTVALSPGQKGHLINRTYRFLLMGADPGIWNSELFQAAMDLHQNGFTQDEARSMLEAPTKKGANLGYLDPKDLATIKSAFSRKPSYPPRLGSQPAQPLKKGKLNFAEICSWLRSRNLPLERDERTFEIYLGRQPISVDAETLSVRHQLETSGYIVKKEEISDAHVHVASEHCFNPVTEYLNSLVWDGTPRLSELPEQVFHLPDNNMYSVYLTKWAISAVARAYHPGCKVDTVLILQGAQGCGKSTFFKTMAGEWFTDSSLPLENKDSLMMLSRNWIVEWSELDSLVRSKNQSTVKAFISSSEDQFRRPYGKDIVSVKRTCVFTGTTNDREFLVDETGSRRFMVIAGLTKIDRIDPNTRNQLWAEAAHLYRNGAEWHLTQEEEQFQAEHNHAHKPQDIWLPIIENYVSVKSEVALSELLEKCLGLAAKDMNNSSGNRVKTCLRFLGWDPVKKKLNGKTVRLWARPESETVEVNPSA